MDEIILMGSNEEYEKFLREAVEGDDDEMFMVATMNLEMGNALSNIGAAIEERGIDLNNFTYYRCTTALMMMVFAKAIRTVPSKDRHLFATAVLKDFEDRIGDVVQQCS